MKTRHAPRLWAVFSALALTLNAAPAITWTVDAAGSGPAVSPTMHGVFFEDINYAGDGGLYAELVENRSFEHREGLYAWREEKRGAARATQALAREDPIHPNNPRFLRLDIADAGGGYGISNVGYGGIPVKAGEAYRFAVHARAGSTFSGGLTVRVESANGTLLAEGKIAKLTPAWQRHEVMLACSGTDRAARLVVLADAAGRVDLDMISLFPKNTFKGRENGLRADLAQLVADMKPGFMRFPGGCIVEGNGLANAYRWKDTVGDIATRKQNWNRWTQEDSRRPDHHYHQTYGLGFFEFFQFCEDIGAAPVPVINCGMACQFQGGALVPMAELGPWVQDALDLVEFANGPVTSTWGKLRAQMGHPEPFGMKHLGVGNEQWGQGYFERYQVFQKALKEKHPEIELISTSGPGVNDRNWDFAWNKFRSGVPADVVDEHYYRPPEWFLQHATRYDGYDRKGPRVFAGEYAAHRRDRASTLDVAVCEAAFMTGLLRNADLVTMSCYAPMFAREGYVQWAPDMIWFDATRVMPTPTYHIQSLYARNRPGRMLPSIFENNLSAGQAAGRAGVGTWLTQAEFKDIVVRNENGELFRSGNGLEGWDMRTGQWSQAQGVFRQTGEEENSVALFGDPSWKDYSISLKARKTGGREGFLILFHSADEKERCWWNIGGWGNTSHALQLGGDELPHVPGKIETGRWYDIRVELKGEEIACYLDNRLIHQVRRPVRPAVYGAAGIDEKTGELIVHVANPSREPRSLTLNLRNWSGRQAAQGWVLTSASPDDRNTLDNPSQVAPKPVTVEAKDGTLHPTLPAWSHTVLRIAK